MAEPRIKYNDYPFDEVVKKAKEIIAQGGTIHQKFTCEKCGARLGMEEPNVFHATGHCDQCGHITNIRARGCNYLVMFSNR